MSDQTIPGTLNLREQIARIDLAIEEAAKLRVEAGKLNAERDKLNVEREKLSIEREKLGAERDKMTVEQMKLLRDRAVVPWQAIAAVLVAGGAVVGATLAVLRAMGLLQ